MHRERGVVLGGASVAGSDFLWQSVGKTQRILPNCHITQCVTSGLTQHTPCLTLPAAQPAACSHWGCLGKQLLGGLTAPVPGRACLQQQTASSRSRLTGQSATTPPLQAPRELQHTPRRRLLGSNHPFRGYLLHAAAPQSRSTRVRGSTAAPCCRSAAAPAPLHNHPPPHTPSPHPPHK